MSSEAHCDPPAWPGQEELPNEEEQEQWNSLENKNFSNENNKCGADYRGWIPKTP